MPITLTITKRPPEPAPVTATGLGKAALTGTRSGIEALPAAATDIADIAGRGAGWAADKVGVDGKSFGEGVTGVVQGALNPGAKIVRIMQATGIIDDAKAAQLLSVYAPGSTDIRGATDATVSALPEAVSKPVTDITRHVPQNTAEAYTDTTASFLPSMLVPGSAVAKIARPFVAGGAVETAGQAAHQLAPEYEEATRIVAGLLVGGADALVSGRSSGATRSALERVGSSPEAMAKVKDMLTAQGMSPEDVASRMRDLGLGSMPMDVSPNFRQEGQRIQAAGGEGRSIIDPLLRQREAGKNARLEGDVTGAVGPEVQRVDVLAGLKDRATEQGAQYKAAHQGQTQPVETAPIIDEIDSEIASTKAKGKLGVLKSIRDSLHLKDSGEIDPSSEGLHGARKAIDEQLYDVNGNVRTDLSPEVAGTLKHYRQQIDAALGEANPQIKGVDTGFKQIKDEGRAFRTGERLYRTDEKALSPVEFKRTYDVMEQGAKDRLLEGVNRETWKQIGISANDLVQLKSILKGSGKWNHQKLATVIGEDKTAALMQALEREATFNETYNKVVQGSKTAESTPPASTRPSALAAAGKALPEMAGASYVGGPAAAGGVALSHLKRYLSELMASRGGGVTPENGPMARMLTSTRPDDLAQAMKIFENKSAAPGDISQRAVLDALLARRQDVEGTKGQ